MRSALLPVGLSFLLAFGALAALPTAVAAQGDFDDEFDDEFDEPEEAPPPASDDDEFDDDEFDDDEFDDDDLDDAEHEFGDDEFDDDEVPGDVADEEPSDDDDFEARLFRQHNSWLGPIGGIRVVDAASASTGSFRVALATEFFFSSGFVVDGDDADHIGGALSLSWSVHDNVELYASLVSFANSNSAGDPTLFQVLGDTHLGVKGFHWVTPFLAIGGDLDLALLNTVGDIGLVFKSTSFGLRGNLTVDLRGLPSPVPFVMRFNAQYFFDNSEKLISGTENARFDNLEDPADRADESRHLVTTIERFGLDINRTDFFNIGLGFEAPLRAAEDFYISPILEWTWGIPVNRQDYSCLFIPDDGDGTGDSCLDIEGVGAFPMNLTLGVRVLPPVKGLAIVLAADIGLTGTNDFVRELAPNAPYQIIFGASYAYDTSPAVSAEPIIREVEVTREVPIPPPVRGRIHAVVVEQGTTTPVAGARVAFGGTDLNPIISTDDGRFVSYLLDPGEVRMELSHDDYEPGACVATIPSDRPGAAPAAPVAPAAEPAAADDGGSDDEFDDEFDEFDEPEETAPAAVAAAAEVSYEDLVVEISCELVARPRRGSVDGRIVADGGAAVIGATVQLSGAGTGNVMSNATGRFQLADLPPGEYQARIEAEGYLIKIQSFSVVAREVAGPEITLIAQPRRSSVTVSRRRLSIRRRINFATNSSEILENSFPLMTEIADVLIRNPDLRTVEIQGHTDNRGPSARNTTLSQERADAVRTWLTQHGVEAGRLEARGYGPSRPRVPNITPANRARNRRVEFHITARD